MTRPLAYLAAILAVLCVVLGLRARHEARRANQAVTALAVSEQANATLKAQVAADQKGMEEERQERTAQEGRLRLASQEAGQLRRRWRSASPADPPGRDAPGSGRVDPLGGRPQAQDLNQRLEATP